MGRLTGHEWWERGETTWVKVNETPQEKDIYLPTSIVSTKQVLSWSWVGVEFLFRSFEIWLELKKVRTV